VHSFERFLLTRYLAALASGGELAWNRWWRNTELSHWLCRHHQLVGLRWFPADPVAGDAAAQDAVRDRVRRDLSAKSAAGKSAVGKSAAAAPPPSPLERKLAWVAHQMDLSPPDREVLGLLVRLATSPPFYALSQALKCELVPERFALPQVEDVNLRHIAALLRVAPQSVTRTLSPSGPLLMLGLVEDRHRQDFGASAAVVRLMQAPRLTDDKARQILFGKPKPTALTWADFAHLGEDAALVARLLEAGVRQKAAGINILLHGVPGSGKTAFASVLAARLGLHAMFVGESDEESNEPERSARVGALAIGQKISARADNLILVVDEAEDIFVGVDDGQGANRRGAKVFMHNLVEANPAPTIWISNHPRLMGAAVLRRMTYAVAFPDLDRAARERVVRRAAARHKVGLDEAGVSSLTALGASPALISHGLRVAGLCGGGADLAVRAAGSVLTVMGGRRPVADAQAGVFVPAFARADMDLGSLADRIVASGRMDVSLCLFGLPGTGKSAYARFLAGRMGLEVMEKRASDLLGMFVGESEANIAKAFQEAEQRRAFLIFDEADSLLRDRAGAHQAYEVRQVNEMLTWMERHPNPFVCTTNFAEGLDPAAARRFVFKVCLLPLEREQARALFRHSFGKDAPAGLDALDRLTPGDFAVVARKALLLDDTAPERLVEALAAEIASKPGGPARTIGFRSA